MEFMILVQQLSALPKNERLYAALPSNEGFWQSFDLFISHVVAD